MRYNLNTCYYGLAIFIIGLISFSAMLAPNKAYALREAMPLGADSRIRVVPYTENEVYSFMGHYGYQSSIEFDTDEKVQTISVGDSTTWQITPAGDRIFLKPIEREATTNMTVITDKHVYHFELHAQEAKDIKDPTMVFVLRFTYSKSETNIIDMGSHSDVPDLKDTSKYNMAYTLRGPDSIAPTKVFDDGVFTYFQFRKHDSVPAFFIVRNDLSEEIINYRASGDYIIVERVASRFTLRSGSEIVCVYNEKRLSENPPPPQMKKNMF